MMKLTPSRELYVAGDEMCRNFEHLTNKFYIIHACKDPCHRKLLGYKTHGAPKDDPEYLTAQRPGNLYLNLVDADSDKYIERNMIFDTLNQITRNIMNGNKVLIHCNKGESRSPTLALLWLVLVGDLPTNQGFYEIERRFTALYPRYKPSNGMRQLAMQIIRNDFRRDLEVKKDEFPSRLD